DLNKNILGQKITDVWFDWTVVKKPKLEDFKKLIKNKEIKKVRRKGKNILIDLSSGYLMMVHLKMTGHLLVGKWSIRKAQQEEKVIAIEPQSIVNDSYNRFIHIIFYFKNGKMLALSDMRKFAKILLGKKEEIENLPELKELGPDPLNKNFKFNIFKEIIFSKTGKIKQVLMDQKVISGIGNIYSDDILWLAKISPFKQSNKLTENQLKILFKAIKDILNKAVKLRGTSIRDFRDIRGKKGGYGDNRLVYQREGEECPRCKAIIIRKKIGGRSAHFCPSCQKLK
ncbi:DNA-formamidopyrimidine glycosylase, partial [Patescibacteria group bacterium]|nr:DNA-formamidopyrimidine glycosylase [Patescibacteria group bacterium]